MIFRAFLVSLSTLYQQLLQLLREVACAKPMPFLTDFSLPADLTQFLHPSDALLLIEQPKRISSTKGLEARKQQQQKKSSVKEKNLGQSWKIKEDLGIAIERGVVWFLTFRHSLKGHLPLYDQLTVLLMLYEILFYPDRLELSHYCYDIIDWFSR